MKIVYCIGGTYNSGGMERVLANKANFLVRQGHEVVIITTDQKQRLAYFGIDSQVKHYDLGINYTDNNDRGMLNKLLTYPKKQSLHFKKLSQLLVRLQADIVISMFDHDSNLLWKVKDGSKKILEIHFSRFKRLQYGRKGLWKLIDAYRSRQDLRTAIKYDAFVVLTNEDKGYWGNLHNIYVIPNANTFQPRQSASLINKRVIAIGRYDYQKGFDHLIEAWSKVFLKYPDWTLHIYGHGELREEFEKQIDRLGLDKVVFLENTTTDIEQAYSQSSILAMSSRYEGLPMALLEAQSCGIPMVSYACKCGPSDIIVDGENGFLIPEGDIQGLANHLVQLMADDQLRISMGKKAQEMSSRFEESRVMQLWENLFKKLKSEQE